MSKLRGIARRKPLPPLSEVGSRLLYDPETGEFKWRATGKRELIGALAGSLDKKGYRVIKFGSHGYKAHRLAWALMTGAEPHGDVDHRNGNKADNRWSNLRIASPSSNTANSLLRRDNSTGLKGVSRVTGCNKWQARIRKDGVGIYLGSFETPQLAHEAYLKAATSLFGEFANGGA